MVIGGGHNGLTAAAYLARAGRSVLVLERADHLGGATGSSRVFRGVDANLSRYSYLWGTPVGVTGGNRGRFSFFATPRFTPGDGSWFSSLPPLARTWGRFRDRFNSHRGRGWPTQTAPRRAA